MHLSAHVSLSTKKMVSLADGTKGEWQKLEEELTCSCGNLLREPRTLPCLHTFCTECIYGDDQLKREPDRIPNQEPEKSFSCFVCDSKFSGKELNGIPKNFSMERLVSIVKKRRTYLKGTNEKELEKDEDASDFTVTCSQCEEGTPATKWCLMCEDAEICDECYKSHCRLKLYKLHKVIKLEEFIESPGHILNYRPLCKIHNTQPLELHCKECHSFSCLYCRDKTLDLCMNQLGKEHDSEAVNDVYEAKMPKIKEASINICAAQQRVVKKLERIKSASQELRQVISEEISYVQERFQEIRRLVDKHEDDLLRDLKAVRSTGENLLVKQSIDLSQREKQLTRYGQFTSGMLLPFRFQEVIVYSDWIPKHLEGLDEDDEPVLKLEEVLFRGSFDLNDFAHKLSLLYQINSP